MKQQLLLLIFTLFLGLTATQSQESLTHKIVEEYDYDTESFSESWKEEYTYYPNGRLKETNGYYWNSIVWALGNRFEYTYENGNLKETVHSSMSQLLNELEYYEKEVISYSNNKMTGRKEYNWENGQWVQDEKTDFAGSNNIETFNTDEWDGTQWVADLRGVFNYNAGKITDVTTEELEDGTWTLYEKNTFIRNPSTGRIEEIISQTWSGTEWDNDVKSTYTIDTDGNRRIEIESESQDGTTWVEDDKIEYSYDMNTLLSKYYHPFNMNPYFLNLGIDAMPHYNKVLSRLESGNESSQIPQRGNASWEIESKTTYYYSDDTMGLNDLSNSNFVTVYPNPVKNRLNIKLKDQVQADASLFDINGRLVLEQKIQALSTSLNIEALNSGIYVLKIRTIDGYATKRITKN